MTTPAEPKYSDADIESAVSRDLLAIGVCARNIEITRQQRAGEPNNEDHALRVGIAAALLASRPSTPDKAGVSDADVEAALSEFHDWIGLIDEEREDAQHRVATRAALTHFRSQSTEAVRDGARYRWLRDRKDLDGPRITTWDKTVNEPLYPSPKLADMMIDAAMQERSHD